MKIKIENIDIDKKAVSSELLKNPAAIKAMEKERTKIKSRLEMLKSGGLTFMEIEEPQSTTRGVRARSELKVKVYGDEVYGEGVSWGFLRKYPINEMKAKILQAVRRGGWNA